MYSIAQIRTVVHKPLKAEGDLAATDLSHRYLWNPQAVDQLFADESLSPLPPGEGQGEGYDLSTPGTVHWALTDHENSVRDLVSYDSGTQTTSSVLHRVFDSFGNVTSSTGTADCLFGFTGRQFDAATGLQNNLNRWYDSNTGRWLSQDPLGLRPDANPYRYVGNARTSATDPRGLIAANLYVMLPSGLRRSYPGGYIEYSVGGKTKTISFSDVTGFYGAIQQIANEKGTMTYLILKGHGSVDNIQEDNNNSFIKVTSNSPDATDVYLTIDGQRYRIDNTLKKITNSTTVIALRGCDTFECAKQLAWNLHNGATVSGNWWWSLGLPWSIKNISFWWRSFCFPPKARWPQEGNP